MRILVFNIVLTSLLCAAHASFATESTEPGAACKAAIEDIYSKLDQKSVTTLLETKENELGKFHFFWGMGIRNGLGLWRKDSPIRKSCAELTGQEDLHPEHASGVIMQRVWKLVQERKGND